MTAPRYAIYFVPAPTHPLHRLGSALLGYDCYDGTEPPPPTGAGLPEDWPALTEEPRRYGFHATLKAPFRLAQGGDETALREAVRRLAHAQPDIPRIRPVVRTIGSFVAVVPAERVPALDRLAADCVTRLDRFRAPLTAEDRRRRQGALTTERLRENFESWGYPWVFESFRFHMTLTGPLPADRRDGLADHLAGLVARHLGPGPLAIDRIALLKQPEPQARFRVIAAADLPTQAAVGPALPRP
ncbi:DUF1045 domain-containing protein [Rhodoplanes sp. TEM]|uniref:DUF1045 domain-containing protein n=1 Tax=Rhodoplanes tepidamans TaxID=200616 RepID=A0ABT5JAQ2_RHOTP|nr:MULTISPECIES: DUF1045 domain-containing protein [Rhodoplanes]MDC7786730.1 DUF1045 domain-containing protein [Rhodoplanes tepidamans]MDC7983736.1 DUF1045 domain-containing protein [Rhodoplanes sp. TEM]MDQ0358167.1 putative phosphonate metabolism protein [Rhodoplanes tepidamans]